MLLSLLVLFFAVIEAFSASDSMESSIQRSSTPKQAFSWDLNQSYKQSSIASKDSEKGEEHTSAYHGSDLLWGKKRKRNSEMKQKDLRTPTNSPKKPRTSISKPRQIDEDDEKDTLLKMVGVKQGRGKGKRFKGSKNELCNPHTPSCKHWDRLDIVQQRREKRKMRYYAADPADREKAKEQQRNLYNSLSPSERIARNSRQYAMRKKFLRKLKPEERSEWYGKKAEKERERKLRIRMGEHTPTPKKSLQTQKKKKKRKPIVTSSASES